MLCCSITCFLIREISSFIIGRFSSCCRIPLIWESLNLFAVPVTLSNRNLQPCWVGFANLQLLKISLIILKFIKGFHYFLIDLCALEIELAYFSIASSEIDSSTFSSGFENMTGLLTLKVSFHT